MNNTEVKGNWNEQKGNRNKKFSALSDNYLMYEEGKKEEMFGKLQSRLKRRIARDNWSARINYFL